MPHDNGHWSLNMTKRPEVLLEILRDTSKNPDVLVPLWRGEGEVLIRLHLTMTGHAERSRKV